MPRLLTNLEIQEVSSVDRGAAKGARALLFKREAPVNQETIDKALALALKSALAEGGKTEDLIALFKEFQAFVAKAPQEEIEMTNDEIAKLVAAEVAKVLAEMEKGKQKPSNTADADEGDASDATGGYEGGADRRGAKVPGKKKIDGDADEAKGRKPKFGKGEAEAEEKTEVTVDKRDEEIKKLHDEVQKLREKDQRVEFGKRAEAIGLAAADGEMLLKAHRGDPEALKGMEDKIAALVKQVNEGKLFEEFGSAGVSGGSAHDALVAKASEIRKRGGNEKMTAEAAYVKAMDENPELTKQEKVERDRRINKQAQ